MKNINILVIAIWLSVYQLAANAEHTDHSEKAYGLHGMAVFKIDDTFYASHMPLANSIHAHQIIFSFSLSAADNNALLALAEKVNLLTLEPELFDLMDLMKGDKTQIKVNVYENHFERGGTRKMEGVVINVSEILLSEPLSGQKNGQFYVLPTTPDKGMLVHRIDKNPSYDQILEVGFNTPRTKSDKLELINLSEFDSALNQSIKDLTISREIYLERQDFQ